MEPAKPEEAPSTIAKLRCTSTPKRHEPAAPKPLRRFVAAGVVILVGAAPAMSAGPAAQQFGALTEIAPNEQIELAMSAAPAEIAREATIYVLGAAGYVKVQTGANGFTCLVERQYLHTLEPTCYDAEGTATTLQARLYVEELRAAGLTEDEIERRVKQRYQTGLFKAPRKPGVVYMLSPHNWVMNDRTGKVINVPPHLMFYAPYARQTEVGPFMGPQMPYVVLEGRPDAYIIVAPGLMAAGIQKRLGASPPNANSHHHAPASSTK